MIAKGEKRERVAAKGRGWERKSQEETKENTRVGG